MKNLLIFVLALFFIFSIARLALAVGAARGIGSEKSSHNFSHELWLPVKKICITCHTPHRRGKKNVKKYADGLPWKQDISISSFSVFHSSWSPSLTDTHDTTWISPLTKRQGALPDGLSKLCLGCHDGVIATDVFKLHHFVSLEYDVTKAELRDPDLTKMGVSGPISEVLDLGKIQCSSCHDAHDEESVAGTKLLREDKDKICVVCHKK